MPDIQIVGGSYQMEAVSFDNQRCVNLMPIASESGSSKSASALRSTGGTTLFATAGTGAVRGGIEKKGRCFFVSGSGFYEIFSDGSTTLHGTLNTFSGVVFLEDNPTQIMITDGLSGYIFTTSTDTFAEITDIDFPVPSSLTFQDGYFIVSEKDTNKFYISNINDGTSWETLDFTTVETVPDDIVGIVSDKTNLWIFGSKGTDIYQNTGAALFPFGRISGAFIETGCSAAATIKPLNNTIYWLGTDENGNAVVWRADGYNAVRISTQAIERKISEANDYTNSFAYVYHERGHAYYCLQIRGLNTTLVLDVATGLWHERTGRNLSTGLEEEFRATCHVFFDQKHLIGDKDSGKIFQLSLDTYMDDGEEIIRRRITRHYADEKRVIDHDILELDMETGVGLSSGQGSDPIISMRYSDDGGRTWSSWLDKSFGKLGEYDKRVQWRQLGQSRDRVYDFRVSDPVFVQINAGYLNND